VTCTSCIQVRDDSDSIESNIAMDFCQLSYDSSTSTDEGYYSMIRCAVNSQVGSLQEQLRLSEEGENEHCVMPFIYGSGAN